MSCGECEICLAPEGWICKESGNFYTSGEYHRIIDYFNIHGVSFEQKVESVKYLLDYNTIEILKVLLTENDNPCSLDLETSLNIVATLSFIESKLSDNMDDIETTSSVINSYPLQNGGDDS